MPVRKLLALITFITIPAFAGIFDGKTKEELFKYEIVIIKRTSDSHGVVIGRMTRSNYKVVKIDDTKPLRIAEFPEEYHNTIVQLHNKLVEYQKIVDKYETGYNTVILHGGIGKDGLTTHVNGDHWEVSEKETPVGGFTYCRSQFYIGLCGSAFTNSLYTLGLKLDF
jgi:hypothetical protein